MFRWIRKSFLRANARRYLGALIFPVPPDHPEAAKALRGCLNLAVSRSWNSRQLAAVAAAVFFLRFMREELSDQQLAHARHQVEHNTPRGFEAEILWLTKQPKMVCRPEWNALVYSLTLASSLLTVWLARGHIDKPTKDYFSRAVAIGLSGVDDESCQAEQAALLVLIGRPETQVVVAALAGAERRWLGTAGRLAAIAFITLFGALGSTMLFTAFRATYDPAVPFFIGMLLLIPCWFAYARAFRRT